MSTILEQIREIPGYIRWAFTSRTIAAVVIALLFIFVLFFSNKVAGVFRKFFIVLCIGASVYAAIAKKYDILWTAVFMLIILAIVRLIAYIIRTVRQNRINARIEERALAKAAQRRGSWKNKQGYSGQAKPIEDDYTPGEMSKDEIADVIENDKADHPAFSSDVNAEDPSAAGTDAAGSEAVSAAQAVKADASAAAQSVKADASAAAQTVKADASAAAQSVKADAVSAAEKAAAPEASGTAAGKQ